MSVTFTATNLVDIKVSSCTISAWVGDLEVLAMHTGHGWFIPSEDVTLADVIRAAVTLQDVLDEQRRSA